MIEILQNTKSKIASVNLIYRTKWTNFKLRIAHGIDFIVTLFIALITFITAMTPILCENLFIKSYGVIYSQLFFTAGAMFASILAITFALSIFSIGQASDKGTPTVLQLFYKDVINWVVFVCLSTFTITSLFLGVINLTGKTTSWMLSVEFIFIGSTFILLQFQYKHIARLINPNWQIKNLTDSCSKYLNATEKYVDDIIQLKLISLPDDVIEGKKETDLKNLKEAAVYAKIPNLITSINKYLEQLYAILQKYSIRQEYEVIQHSLTATCFIINRYIEMRKTSSVAHMVEFLTFQTDLDDFLVPNYERIIAINILAIRSKDTILAKLVLKSLESVSLNYSEIEPVGLKHEHPTNIAVAYLTGGIEECLRADMFDIGIYGSEAISGLGIFCVKNGDSIGIHMAYQHLRDKVALYGISKNQNYLVSYALDGIAKIIWAVIFQKMYGADMSVKVGLETVKTITEWVLMTTNEESMEGKNNISHSLGSFYDIAKNTAIGILLAKLADSILKETDAEKKKKLVAIFIRVDKEVWRFFRDIGQMSAIKESFLLHFINMNVRQISRAIIFLCKDNMVKNNDKEKLLNDLTWYLSVFWWSYDKAKHIGGFQIIQDADLLSEVGIQSITLKEVHFNFLRVAEHVASSIHSLAVQLLEKGENQYDKPLQIVGKMFNLGIITYKENISNLNTKIDGYIKEFQLSFIKKYPENEKALLEELEELKSSIHERVHFDSRALLSKIISEEDIEKYIEHVKNIMVIAK